MKDSKTTKSSAKKKTNNSRNASSHHDNVRVTKVSPVEENFLDDDKDDKRLIVFIAIAILVIIGTVIGLLVGCQKEEEPEPENPKDDDIVIPIDNNQTEDDEDDGVKTVEIVRKVAALSNSDSDETEEREEEVVVEEPTTYVVTYIVETDTSDEPNEVTKEVEEGGLAEDTVSGYTDCEFYDENDEEFNFENPVTGDTTIYAYCSLVHYTIEYVNESGAENPNTTTEYTVEDGDVELQDLDVTPWHGWFANYDSETDEYSNQVTSLKEAIEFADENNHVIIYARYGIESDEPMPTCSYIISILGQDGEEIFGDCKYEEEGNSYTLPSDLDYCNGSTCLGYVDASNPDGPVLEPGTIVSLEEYSEFIIVCDGGSDDGSGDDVIAGGCPDGDTDCYVPGQTPAGQDPATGDSCNPELEDCTESGNSTQSGDEPGETPSGDEPGQTPTGDEPGQTPSEDNSTTEDSCNPELKDCTEQSSGSNDNPSGDENGTGSNEGTNPSGNDESGNVEQGESGNDAGGETAGENQTPTVEEPGTTDVLPEPNPQTPEIPEGE